MIEIHKSTAIKGDTVLSELVGRHDSLLNELSPRNATVVWRLNDSQSLQSVVLQISDHYRRFARELTVTELADEDRVYAKVARLIGDLIYQECEKLRDQETLAHLASFTPGRLCLRFAQENPEIPLPSSTNATSAVLFADISGFTFLTGELAKKGPGGAEELTTVLNKYFGELIQIVNRYGGDVLKFAGDALLATFDDRVPGDNLNDAAARAASASVAIQEQLQTFPLVEGTRLSLKISLAAGSLRFLHLGGVFGRCELLMVGQPLLELGAANDLAGPGDIVAAASFWNCLKQQPAASSHRLARRAHAVWLCHQARSVVDAIDNGTDDADQQAVSASSDRRDARLHTCRDLLASLRGSNGMDWRITQGHGDLCQSARLRSTHARRRGPRSHGRSAEDDLQIRRESE